MFFSKKIVSKKSNLCDGIGIFAKERIYKGEKLLEFIGEIKIGSGNDYTLQIDTNKHLGRSGYLDDFVNHSCLPNCYIRFRDISLVSLTNISVGEELSFHYCTTEYDLGKFSFQCICGSQNCLGQVGGYKYLSESNRQQMSKFLFPHLKMLANIA